MAGVVDLIRQKNNLHQTPLISIVAVASIIVLGWMVELLAAQQPNAKPDVRSPDLSPYVLVLGTAQDAGYPQAGCQKNCCRPAWKDHSKSRFPTSLAVVDPSTRQRFLLDCSWQLPHQLQMLQEDFGRHDSPGIDGIVLTHGHIGHYTGLMHLGREVMGADSVPVYAMPRMKQFLTSNGPWSLLVKLKNIRLEAIQKEQTFSLNPNVSVTPIVVPHRGEFTETAGFIVSLEVTESGTKTKSRKILYLPDIDKWDRWEKKIETVIQHVDLAFLDATFYQNGEIPGRDMSQIPHPFIEESLLRFQALNPQERNKVHFIHLNHTNPAMNPNSAAASAIRRSGMHLAEQGRRY